MILIYSLHIDSPRLQYILHELFTRRLGVVYSLTGDLNSFKNHVGPKINYSHQSIDDCLHIKPHELLFDQNISIYNVNVNHNNEWDTFIWEQNGDVPFELFAASFYLLSRYEEYLPHKVDEHNRFDHEQSLAVQYGFIETPLIDKWAIKLKILLENKFGPIPSQPPSYQFISTFDIDTAYLYKGLEYGKQLKKTIKSASLMRFGKLAEQLQVMNNKIDDPYDTYDYIQHIAKQTPILYFVHCGGDSEYDESISLETIEMQHLLANLSKQSAIGIHPSYNSFNNSEIISTEKQKLEKVLSKKITQSRQHFLRFQLPQTMKLLIECGITEDYSMAYSGVSGFRASTAHPFLFFDLEQNVCTSLLLYPTTIMDVTLRHNMNLTISSAINKAEQLIQEVKQVNGLFINLWHNSSFSHTDEWYDWREVFEKIYILGR